MSLTKLSIAAGLDDARLIENRLAQLEGTPIQAVTRFEDGKNGWLVEAYLDSPLAASALSGILAGVDQHAPPVQVCVPDENWVELVQKMLHPIAAGRFLVHGPHDRAEASGNRFAIEIEAGEAFGTAHHASTQGCLIALSDGLDGWNPRRVLDVGTGSGVLAIAAALMLQRSSILASDIDPRAVEIARENAGLNGVGSKIEVLEATGLDHPRLSAPASFGLIVANILAAPLIGLAPALARAIEPGGHAVLSGLLDEQAPAVTVAFEAAGFETARDLPIAGWSTLVLQRAG